MSNDRFIVKLDRNPNAANEMDDNVLRGFKKAVRNNQPRMAMEYLTHILDILINDEEETAKSNPDPGPVKRTAKSTAAAEKTAPKAEKTEAE